MDRGCAGKEYKDSVRQSGSLESEEQEKEAAEPLPFLQASVTVPPYSIKHSAQYLLTP